MKYYLNKVYCLKYGYSLYVKEKVQLFAASQTIRKHKSCYLKISGHSAHCVTGLTNSISRNSKIRP